MPYETNEDLPGRIRTQFPGADAQTAFREAWNAAYAGTCEDRGDERESCAFAIATAAAKKVGKSILEALQKFFRGSDLELDDTLAQELRKGFKEGPSGRVKLERTVPIHKVDQERRIVSSVVYEPDTPDAHGDSMTATEIEKSAHGFMIRYSQGHGELGADHQAELSRAAVVPIESYVAPVDFQLGSQSVRKGSWILSAKVFDEEVWKGIKARKYTGWSFEGWGMRRPA